MNRLVVLPIFQLAEKIDGDSNLVIYTSARAQLTTQSGVLILAGGESRPGFIVFEIIWTWVLVRCFSSVIIGGIIDKIGRNLGTQDTRTTYKSQIHNFHNIGRNLKIQFSCIHSEHYRELELIQFC